ncbi:MAG: hypothetical protein PF448_13025 [Bacteroidales bacterium]|jgi:hypothetical protein|nr:hypothetical protein [Bacteroidales bacterium]
MKQKFNAMLERLGFTAKVKSNSLTAKERRTLNAECKKEFDGKSLNSVLQSIAAENETEEDQVVAEMATILGLDAEGNDPEGNDPEGNDPEGDDPEGDDPEGDDPEGDDPGTGKTAKIMKTASQRLKKLQAENKRLRGESESPKAPKVIGAGNQGKKILLCGPGTNKTHLYGIPHDMFSLDKTWNARAARGVVAEGRYRDEEIANLKAEFDQYSMDFASHYAEAKASGQLATIVAGNMDYDDLASDLGAYYRVRRMDAIITHLKRLTSVKGIFPLVSNIQDEQVMTNQFEGRSFTQAYQSGRVFSGTFKFQPEKAKVSDVMFKFKFSDLKDLERQFIGYLNREGSDPIKWTFIEWILVQCAVIQHNEQELRYVKGIALPSTTNEPAYFMYGSTGILNTMDDAWEKQNRMYVFGDKRTYSSSTILEYVRSFVRSVHHMRGRIDDVVLCMNDIHIPDFLEAYREKYGKDSNYNGEKMEVKDFPLPKIVRVPNMGYNRYDMWIMPEGALELHENKPGEFYSYYFQRDLEELFVTSYGKEGTYAFAGRKYETRAALLAAKGRHTNIFRNNPVTLLADGDTTADAELNDWFEAVENAAATAFTDFENAVEGVVYKLLIGHMTNATTVAKAGKFSEITAAFNPDALGDYLKVIYNPTTSQFIEIERKVNGVVAVNAAAKAPAYVE